MNQPSRDLGASLHHQVAAVLRSGIRSGRYSAGDYLPGEETLTEKFSVSRATVRRALLSLEQEGLIERRQGRGTRVVWRGGEAPLATSLSTHLEMAGGPDPGDAVLVRGFEQTLPPDPVREALGLAQGAPAWKLVRIRARGDRPLWTMVNHFPLEVGEKLRAAPWERTTIFNALRRAGHPCDRAEETIGATLADPEVAALIDVQVGAPLLELSRLMLDVDGRPIGHQLTLVPPERRKLQLVIQADENGLPDVGVLIPRGA